MRFTLSWLKQFLDTNASLEKIAHTLTMTGLEVEDIEDKAVLTHYLHNYKSGVKKHYQKDALNLSSSYGNYF